MPQQKSKSGLWLLLLLLLILIGAGAWWFALRPAVQSRGMQRDAIDAPEVASDKRQSAPVAANKQLDLPKPADAVKPGPSPKPEAKAPEVPVSPKPVAVPKPADPPEAATPSAPTTEPEKTLPPVAEFGTEVHEGESLFNFVVSGITVDFQNQPVPGCTISVRLYAWPPERSKKLTAGSEIPVAGVSDKEGVFRIPVRAVVKDGWQVFVGVSASKEGYGGSNMAGAAVHDGAEIKDLRLEMPLAITGNLRVVDAQGNGIGGADVFMTPLLKQDPTWPENVRFPPRGYYGGTDEKGYISFPVLVVGLYRVQVNAPGYIVERGSEDFEVTGGQDTMALPDIVVRRVPVITARLVDGAGKTQHAADQVKILNAAGVEVMSARVTREMEEGFYVNLPDLAPGTYRVVIVCFTGYEDFSLDEVQVKGDAATQLGDLKLKKEEK